METIKIRDLRGSVVERMSRSGKLVGITNNRVLSAVMIPLSPAWIEHVVEANGTRVAQNVAEGEQERHARLPLVTLDDALGREHPDASRLASALPSAGGPGVAMDTAAGLALVRRLSLGLTRPGQAAGPDVDGAAVRTVRMGDLDGSTLKAAAETGDVVAVTHDRTLVAFLIPVTQDLVAHLVETNLSRVTYNVMRGEVERRSPLGYTTIEDVVAPPDHAGARVAAEGSRRARLPRRRPLAAGT